MSNYRFHLKIRGVIQNALPQETSLSGGIPELKYTYLPAGHAKALHPNSILVVGIRGAGKSYWWSALQSEDHRSLVGRNLPRAGINRETRVSQGFGEKSSPNDYPGKDAIDDLLRDFEARQIWRTVILIHLIKRAERDGPLSGQSLWKERIGWVQKNPEQVERLFFEVDSTLDQSGIYHLILFDALDRTADDWQPMGKIVRGLLQVLLEFRSYKRIRPKAFLRPDQLEDTSVTAFPDSSKVLSQKVELTWPRNELYGLFWQHLANETENGQLFRDGCNQGFGLIWNEQEGVWLVPEKLRVDENKQRDVFHAMTGPWMGRDRRRGFPYTWLPNHLGDARRQVSPRSFLAALRHAASDNPKPDYDYPLHYESIKRGVQEASKIRVREMQEDYPWVEKLMKPLSGLSVPCSFDEISNRWEKDETLRKLLQEIKEEVVKLPPAHINAGEFGVRQNLEELGVFERMSDSRVNLPDVYRVGYGIGRRGGVKAVARK